jgi:hypothetical protein
VATQADNIVPGLRDLQSLLYRLITAPDGVEAGLRLEPAIGQKGLASIISGDSHLMARERLEIYANAYFYRLLNACKQDFPYTYSVLGAINFHNLVTGYLVDSPPSAPSLYYAGRYLADYLAADRLVEQFPFAADLARLERTSIEVFHGPDAEILDQDSLRQLAPEAWPSFILRLHPAAQILDVGWQVDKLVAAIEQGRRWETPERRPLSLLVWRRGWTVHHREVQRGERVALMAASDGVDFASICQIFFETAIPEIDGADGADSPDLPAAIHAMLARWLNEGVLARADS